MSGFYKKAVVWLGLNEEYPDAAPHPHDPRDENAESRREAVVPLDDDLSSGVVPTVTETKPMDTPAKGPTPAPGPSPSPEQRRVKPAGPPTKNPLTANASHDRSEGTVRAIPMEDEARSGSSGVGTVLPSASATGAAAGTVRAVPMPKTTKPQVVVPKSFNNAQDIADLYRDNKPVIVNMQNAERDLARRLIDFSSGLCYGLGGGMEKVAKDVYLLTPTDVEVSAADRDAF